MIPWGAEEVPDPAEEGTGPEEGPGEWVRGP